MGGPEHHKKKINEKPEEKLMRHGHSNNYF